VSEPDDPREQFDEHAEWDALAVGWALSALDTEDEERFAEHLPGCDRCTATVRESLYTVADLAYALPDEAPPASLKSRLMAAVAAEPRSAGTEAEMPAEPAAEEWPLGEPHPGSPGYGLDWFAKPTRTGEPGTHEPPAVERRPEPGSGVDEPTIETRRPDLRGGAGGPSRPDLTPSEYRGGDLPDADADAADHGAADRGAADRGDADHGAADRGVMARGLAGRGSADQAEADETVWVAADRGEGDRGEGDRAGDRGDEADVVALASRRRTVRRATIGVAAAAILALVAGLLAWNVNLRNDRDDLRQIVAQREAAIQQLTASGPARVAALTADGKPSPARKATLVVRGDQIEIVIETLGATTGDETYWLWTLRCDTPQPTDLKPIRGFTVAQSEFSVRDIGSDPGVASAPCFAISSELGTATPKAPRQVVAVGQPE
jgi:hypothetical protein